jgi:hypothetical protein
MRLTGAAVSLSVDKIIAKARGQVAQFWQLEWLGWLNRTEFFWLHWLVAHNRRSDWSAKLAPWLAARLSLLPLSLPFLCHALVDIRRPNYSRRWLLLLLRRLRLLRERWWW